MEQLAARLGQARADAENATRALEVRVVSAENTLHQTGTLLEKSDTAARTLEARIAAAESTLDTASTHLEQVQEKIEAQASIRAHDLAEIQKREANHLGSLERIEDRIVRLESKGSDPAIERRLDNIEQALAGVVSKLEQSDPIAALADTLRQVNQRLDSVEKSHGEMLAELRASLGQAPVAATAVAVPSFDAAHEPPQFDLPKFEPSAFASAPAEPLHEPKLAEPKPVPEIPVSVFEEPIFMAEPAASTTPFVDPSELDDPVTDDGFAPKASAFSADAPQGDATHDDAFASDSLAQDAFADHFEMPQDFADAMAQSVPVGDNFLQRRTPLWRRPLPKSSPSAPVAASIGAVAKAPAKKNPASVTSSCWSLALSPCCPSRWA